MAALDALDPISDAQLDREHDSATPLPSMSTSMRASDRRMARIRPWLGLGSRSHVPTDWEDGARFARFHHAHFPFIFLDFSFT